MDFLLKTAPDWNSDPDQLASRLGIRVTTVGPDLVVGTMPVSGNRQPFGLLAGGASAALAETLGSIGAVMHAGPNSSVVGLNISCTHLQAVRHGVITGRATPVRLGTSVCHYRIEIASEDAPLIASAELTCLVKRRRS